MTDSSSLKLSKEKMKMYAKGTMSLGGGKNPHERQREESEARKKREEEEAAALYKDFASEFLEPSSGRNNHKSSFVQSGDYSSREKRPFDDRDYDRGHDYKSRRRSWEKDSSASSNTAEDEASKQKSKGKGKSTLETFKEELKREQELREQRASTKRPHMDHERGGGSGGYDSVNTSVGAKLELAGLHSGSYDSGDPNTTNLYIGNMSAQITEEFLCQEFGRFGPLASVKIMWPRNDTSRTRLCGFVAFMKREHAAKALEKLNGKQILGCEMRVGWGKAVPLPLVPFYARENVIPTTVPFNALPTPSRYLEPMPPGLTEFERQMWESEILVTIPRDKSLRRLIHRLIEYVIREGPLFEAMVMSTEKDNPQFRFIFDNHTPEHIYYRWKLFSILNGESVYDWSTEPFRMFERGSLWIPPRHMREGEDDEDEVVQKGHLRTRDRDQLEQILRQLIDDRDRIAEAMVFCIDHADAAEEIVECITESLSILETPIPTKLARFHLISDILHNSTVAVHNASYFRQRFEAQLPHIASQLNKTYNAIVGRIRAEQFKTNIINCFRVWQDWSLYPSNYVRSLCDIFLVKKPVASKPALPAQLVTAQPVASKPVVEEEEEDLDGKPMDEDDEDIDGKPMDEDEEDLDGEPM